MSESEQYRAGFEAWARDNGHPIRFNADGSYAGMNSYRFEGYAGARREAGAEPRAQPVAWLMQPSGTVWGDKEEAEKIIAASDFQKTLVPLYTASGALTDDAIPAQGWCTPVDTNVMIALTREGRNAQASSSADDAKDTALETMDHDQLGKLGQHYANGK